VIVLDENIDEFQQQMLRKWKYHFKQIGAGVGRRGMKDENIIPHLIRTKKCTFFTLDKGFYSQELCHKSYCIVFLSVSQFETSLFIKKFLKHKEFNNHTKRNGKVFLLEHKNIKYFSLNTTKEKRAIWNR
jgi:hypothetical protein